MSTHAKTNAAIVVLTAVGALVATNMYIAPTQSAHRGMVYNSVPHPEQDRRDTIFDRTQLMADAKKKKPWNMTTAERQRVG